MKTYFKILTMTAGIQALAYSLSRISDCLPGIGPALPAGILAAGMLLSLFFGILLPCKWYQTLRGRLLGILLLVTNYIPLAVVIIGITFVKGIIKALGQLPANFG